MPELVAGEGEIDREVCNDERPTPRLVSGSAVRQSHWATGGRVPVSDSRNRDGFGCPLPIISSQRNNRLGCMKCPSRDVDHVREIPLVWQNMPSVRFSLRGCDREQRRSQEEEVSYFLTAASARASGSTAAAAAPPATSPPIFGGRQNAMLLPPFAAEAGGHRNHLMIGSFML